MTLPAHTLSLRREGTTLVTVDIQEKLVAAMNQKVVSRMLNNCAILIRGMTALGVPVLVTEQYPKGLGATVPELREALGNDVAPVEKVEFACTGASAFGARLAEHGTETAVLCGMEAHVCVVQTAAGLVEQGIDVWVAGDAVCSRTKENWRAALRLLEHAGAVVAPTETILFWLLGKAGTPEFKTISRLVR